ALLSRNADRRLLAPAESINAVTVGATHSDGSVFPSVANRFDLFAAGGISPISRVGHGFRRAIKPDILMPGGRVLYLERIVGSAIPTTRDAVLLKALVVHGAGWGEWASTLLARRPDVTEHAEKKDFLARCLGYGSADVARALECGAQRATLIGTGELAMDEAL